MPPTYSTPTQSLLPHAPLMSLTSSHCHVHIHSFTLPTDIYSCCCSCCSPCGSSCCCCSCHLSAWLYPCAYMLALLLPPSMSTEGGTCCSCYLPQWLSPCAVATYSFYDQRTRVDICSCCSSCCCAFYLPYGLTHAHTLNILLLQPMHAK